MPPPSLPSPSMPKYEMQSYKLLHNEESLDGDTLLRNRRNASRTSCGTTVTLKQAFMGSLLVVMLLMIGFMAGYCIPKPRYQEASVDFGSDFEFFEGKHFEAYPRRYNGSLFKRSKFGGTPTPESDAEWFRFANTGNVQFMPQYPAFLNASKEDFESTTSLTSDTAVRSDDGGYMVSLEMFHQVHCLDQIRKFIDLDYYAAKDPEWPFRTMLREHAGHCVDMIRDVLMCTGDTGVITYHWVANQSAPVPDFNTMHNCRDPEEILKWTKEHEVEITKAFKKPKGAMEVPELW